MTSEYERYLASSHREHANEVLLLAAVLLLVNVAFGALEIPLIADDELSVGVVPVRLFGVVTGVAAIAVARAATTRPSLRLAHSLLVIAVAVTVFGLGLLYHTPTPVAVATVMAVYLVSSWALPAGAMAAAVVSLGDLVPLIVWPEESTIVDYNGSLLVEYLLAHLVAHILGVALSRSRGRRSQRLFSTAEEQRELITNLRDARTDLTAMGGLLSACAVCRKINDDGRWVRLEEYVVTHSDTQVSHGYCPDCSEATLSAFRNVDDRESREGDPDYS